MAKAEGGVDSDLPETIQAGSPPGATLPVSPRPAGRGEEGSLVEELKASLIAMIHERTLRPGEIIRERPLALQLGVSRTPLREAMGLLQAVGVIERSGRTWRVGDLDLKRFLEAIQLRKLLEGEATRLAAGRISPDRIDAVIEAVEQGRERKSLSAIGHQKLDDDIHGLIASASGNRLLADTIESVRQRMILFNAHQDPERSAAVHDEHLALLHALRRGDAERARSRMLDHLDNIRLSIIQMLSRI